MADKKINSKTVSRVLSLLKKHIPLIIISLVLATVSVVLSLYIPILFGEAIDGIVEKGKVDFDLVSECLIKAVAVVLISALTSWAMTTINNRVAYLAVRDLREKAYKKINKLPLKYIDGHSTGDLTSRIIADADQFSDGLLLGFSQFFSGVVTIVATLAFMLTIDGWITLVAVVLTPLSLFVARYISKNTYDLFKKQSSIKGEQTGLIDETVGNLKTVIAYNYMPTSRERFANINDQLEKTSRKAIFLSSLVNPSTRFVNAIVYAAVGLVGGLFAISGRVSVGGLTCVLNYANQYTKPFNEISGVITELTNALACASRIFEFLDADEEISDENSLTLETVSGNIELKNVSFSYVPEKPLIQGLNLSVKKGQRIAIVGPTGCGKTTLINLLMRFYDVTDGSISVEGVDIKDCTRHSLRKGYGMVLQETWLKSGTIRENISMGKPEATIDEIIAAAKATHAHNFIKRLPKGYDTVIGEEGGNLSAGQKQLLCITRVMLLSPPMLILDEATSSIDTKTEIRVQRAFEKLMAGKTSFIVAHRLSTIMNADKILVMRDGNIVEQGTHEELLSKGGFYSELYNSQFRH